MFDNNDNKPKVRYHRSKDEVRRIAKAIQEHGEDRLTPTQLDYATRYYRDGMAFPLIARVAGVNRSTVSRTVERAVLRLWPEVFS